MYKIEIRGSAENLQRISMFLDNNHIKHCVIDNDDYSHPIEEIEESIDWPF